MHSSREPRCDVHNLPIIKIELHSRRLLCEKCLSETDDTRRQRLELLRMDLSKQYQVEAAELKRLKEQADRLTDLFLSKNMMEAKKMINKGSSQAQKIIEEVLDKQVKATNDALKSSAERELERWKGLDGRHFSSGYLEFEHERGAIEERLTALKTDLKRQIGERLKTALRQYYRKLFEF